MYKLKIMKTASIWYDEALDLILFCSCPQCSTALGLAAGLVVSRVSGHESLLFLSPATVGRRSRAE